MGMLNWNNALSFAGGAAAQVGLEGVRASLDEQKIELASRLAEQRTIGAEQRAPGVVAATKTAELDATAGATIRNAPGLLDVETKRARALNDETTRAELERFKALAPEKRAEAIATEVEKVKALSTPEMLAAARKIKEAGHIVDPVYALVPQADGTVLAVNSHDAKDTKVLKDADGKPIVRKDPEEVKAAVAVINMANTNLKIAEAAYKVDASSLEPGVAKKAAVTWEAAQREAKELTAPAYAVLYAKAKIPGVSDKPDAPAPVPGEADIAKLKTNPKSFTAIFDAKFGAGAAAKALGTAPATAPAQPGLLNATLTPQQKREADMRAEYDAEEARKKLERERSQQEFRDNLERTSLRSGM